MFFISFEQGEAELTLKMLAEAGAKGLSFVCDSRDRYEVRKVFSSLEEKWGCIDVW